MRARSAKSAWLGRCARPITTGTHRAALGSGRIIDRVIGAVVAIPAGLLAVVAGWAGLAAVTVVLAVVGTLDHLAETRANAMEA